MARPVTFTATEVQRATELRDKASTVADFRKGLAVILSAIPGFDVDKIAEILGTSRRTVFRDREEIRDQNVTRKKSWGGRRRCSMSLDEEREFLAPWVEQAASGGIPSVPSIHAWSSVLAMMFPSLRPIACSLGMDGARCIRTPGMQRSIRL